MNLSFRILATLPAVLGLPACVQVPEVVTQPPPVVIVQPGAGSAETVNIRLAAVEEHPAADRPITAYSIRFENFRMDEILKMKAVMEHSFPGFVRAGRMTGSEPHLDYYYYSTAGQSKMYELLYGLVGDAHIRDTKILAEGNRFFIRRLGAEYSPAPPPPALVPLPPHYTIQPPRSDDPAVCMGVDGCGLIR